MRRKEAALKGEDPTGQWAGVSTSLKRCLNSMLLQRLEKAHPEDTERKLKKGKEHNFKQKKKWND